MSLLTSFSSQLASIIVKPTSFIKSLWPNRMISASDIPLADDHDDDIVISPLDQLPDDVIRRIFENLSIGERVRCRLVSKSWRRMLMHDNIPMATETPWLIVSNVSTQHHFLSEICFEETCFEESNTEEIVYSYRFKLPENIVNNGGQKEYNWCCCGSSRGWLLIAVGNNLRKTNMLLWNPVSGRTKKLPRLSTLPFFKKFVDDAINKGVDNMSCFIPRVQVFSVGTVECVVVIQFINPLCIGQQQQHRLALCTPHDRSWSTVERGEEQHMIYNDILFHNKKLYVCCKELQQQQPLLGTLEQKLNHDKVIRKGAYTVRLTGCDVEVNLLRFVYDDIVKDVPANQLPLGFSIHERANIMEHLVESCTTGELLVVSAIQDSVSHNNTARGSGPIDTFKLFQTRGFEVRRVAGDCLEKVTSVGDQRIFLGGNGGSFSLPSAYNVNSEVESDCIYFATDSGLGMIMPYGVEVEDIPWNMKYIVREDGCFNHRDNKIQITSTTTRHVDTGSITGWFTPRLF